MQLKRKHFRFGLVAKPALAGLLAVLLLWSATLAVSSSHRHSHPADRAADDAGCIFCLFAHGKVATADIAPVALSVDAVFIGWLPATCLPVSASFDYLLSPSRAPPLSFSI